MRAHREPGDGWKPSREIIGKVRFRCQRVETADGPRVVPGVERVNEVHQFLVADNALKTGLRVVSRLVEIDRRANQLRAAEHCEPGLHERQREAVALRFVELADDEPLASVVLDMRAVIAHQRLDFRLVEATAREDHSGARHVGRCRVGMQTGDDAIDVAFEVDAGPILKLALAVFLQRQPTAKSLTHVRGHDFLNVRKGDDRRVARDESKLFGPCMFREGAGGEPDVIRHEPGAETDSEHQQRDNHEIAGSRCHGKRPLDLIRDAPNHCSRTYSRFSTARPDSHSVPATIAAKHTRLAATDGTSRNTCISTLTAESCGISCLTSACK